MATPTAPQPIDKGDVMVGDAREREDVGVREWDRAKAAELYNAIATGATHEDVAEALAIYRQAHIGIALSRDYTARRATCAEVEAEMRRERDEARAECERLRSSLEELTQWCCGYEKRVLEQGGLLRILVRAEEALTGAALAPSPAADRRNVYACGCSGSDGRCPLHSCP